MKGYPGNFILSLFTVILIKVILTITLPTRIETRSIPVTTTTTTETPSNRAGSPVNVTCPTQCKCSFNLSKWVNETLRTLDCSLRGLKYLSRSSIPKNTESLWLSGNRLDVYTLTYLSVNSQSHLHHVHHHPHVHHHVHSYQDSILELDLSNNSITSLGQSMAHPFLAFGRLKYLNLSVNPIKTLYPGIFRGLKRLEILEISSAKLKYIDEHAFDGLENLQQLYLQNNRISSIFLELFQSIINLHVLNLNGNNLSSLNGGIFASLNSLIELDLSENELKRIDDNSLVGLDTLERINLAANRLTRIPSIALQSLKRIKHIHLSNNYFTSLQTGDLIHSPVQFISISSCPHLTSIERMAFWDLPNLNLLTINSNPRLSFIDSLAFSGTPSLGRLNLQSNSLLTLDGEMIHNIINHRRETPINYHNHHHHHHHQNHYQKHQDQHSTSLDNQLIISLTGNPILCDCNIQFLHQCLQQSVNESKLITIDDGDHLTCNYLTSNESLLIKEMDIGSIDGQCGPIILTENPNGNNNHNSPLNGTSSISTTTINSNGSSVMVINGSMGEKVSLNCRSFGLPQPNIRWIMPNGDIVDSSQVNNNSLQHIQLVKSTHSLRLNHLRLSDSGDYQCEATNVNGKTTLTYRLSVQPMQVQIWPLGVSSTFVSVVWNGSLSTSLTDQHHQVNQLNPNDQYPQSPEPSSTPFNSLPEYQILYKDDEDDDPRGRFETITVGHYPRSYTINHLKPRKRYKLCIAIRDSQSNGNYVQLSCTKVTTSADSSLSSYPHGDPSSSSSSSSTLSTSINDQSSLLSSSLSSGVSSESLVDSSSYLMIAFILSLTAIAIVILSFTILGTQRACIVINRHSPDQLYPSSMDQRQFETPQKSLVHNMAPIPLTQLPEI